MHTKSYRYNKAFCLHEMVSLVEIRYSMEVKTVKELAISMSTSHLSNSIRDRIIFSNLVSSDH